MMEYTGILALAIGLMFASWVLGHFMGYRKGFKDGQMVVLNKVYGKYRQARRKRWFSRGQ